MTEESRLHKRRDFFLFPFYIEGVAVGRGSRKNVFYNVLWSIYTTTLRCAHPFFKKKGNS